VIELYLHLYSDCYWNAISSGQHSWSCTPHCTGDYIGGHSRSSRGRCITG